MKEQNEGQRKELVAYTPPVEELFGGEILPPERGVTIDAEKLRVIRVEMTKYVKAPPVHHFHVVEVEKEKPEQDEGLVGIFIDIAKSTALITGGLVVAAAGLPFLFQKKIAL